MKEHIHHLLEQTVANLNPQASCPPTWKPRCKVDRCKDKAHGDLATNLAMLLCKPARKTPQAALPSSSTCPPRSIAQVEIARPRLHQLLLRPGWLAGQVEGLVTSDNANVKLPAPQTVVVDYSAPTWPKEMAVHLIRSTVLGDVAARALWVPGPQGGPCQPHRRLGPSSAC